MIPSDFIDDLLAKVDIVDVIDEQVPLKKGGQNFMACCPFHKEKSPSFTVSPTKQFYHCFGCGAHGSAIGFVMEYQGLAFVEAVTFLADRVGLKVPKSAEQGNPALAKRKKELKLSLEDVMAQAATFYESSLKHNSHAINYLQQRHLSQETIAHFGIGYAPNDWQALQASFADYPNEHLIQAGLVINKEDKHYDRFRDRIMFPIRNQTGHVVAFGGRVIDKGEPKYLNSPETPLFEKGKELYGLYEARGAIKDANRALVVEGYMDAVMLYQHGIEYTVAALGTATSAAHIKMLFRHTSDVYFAFDGDLAGKKAAWRALENALPLLQDDKALHFLFLPEEHDPDSYVQAFGKAQFETLLLDSSQPFSKYFFKHLSEDIHLATQEGKAELIKVARPLIQQIKAPALNYLLMQQLSQMVDIELHDLMQLIEQAPLKRQAKLKNYHLPVKTFRQPNMSPLVQKQIVTLLINPEWASYIEIPEYLSLDGDFACLAYLTDMLKCLPKISSSAQVLEHVRGSQYEVDLNQLFRQAFESIEQELEQTDEARQAFIEGMQKILTDSKKVQIQQLTLKTKQGGLSSEESRLLLALLCRDSSH